MEVGLTAASVLGIAYLLALIGLRILSALACADRCTNPSLYDGGWESISVAVVVAITTVALLRLAGSRGTIRSFYWVIALTAVFTLVMFAVPLL